MQYLCLVGCKAQPVDGYVIVCLVLTIEVYGNANTKKRLSSWTVQLTGVHLLLLASWIEQTIKVVDVSQ